MQKFIMSIGLLCGLSCANIASAETVTVNVLQNAFTSNPSELYNMSKFYEKWSLYDANGVIMNTNPELAIPNSEFTLITDDNKFYYNEASFSVPSHASGFTPGMEAMVLYYYKDSNMKGVSYVFEINVPVEGDYELEGVIANYSGEYYGPVAAFSDDDLGYTNRMGIVVSETPGNITFEFDSKAYVINAYHTNGDPSDDFAYTPLFMPHYSLGSNPEYKVGTFKIEMPLKTTYKYFSIYAPHQEDRYLVGKLSLSKDVVVTGIEDAVQSEAQGAGETVRYFNLQGCPVDAGNLQPGMYIRLDSTGSKLITHS